MIFPTSLSPSSSGRKIRVQTSLRYSRSWQTLMIASGKAASACRMIGAKRGAKSSGSARPAPAHCCRAASCPKTAAWSAVRPKVSPPGDPSPRSCTSCCSAAGRRSPAAYRRGSRQCRKILQQGGFVRAVCPDNADGLRSFHPKRDISCQHVTGCQALLCAATRSICCIACKKTHSRLFCHLDRHLCCLYFPKSVAHKPFSPVIIESEKKTVSLF